MKHILKVAISSAMTAVAAFALAACVRFQDQPLSPAATLTQFNERSLTDAGLVAFLAKNPAAAPAGAFAWDFNTLALVAFYYNPELDLARAQLAGVKAAGITAATRPNPATSVNVAKNTSEGIPSPWIVTSSLDFTIGVQDKYSYRRAQAARLSEAALYNLASTAWQVRSQVRNHLLALYAAGESVSLLRKQEAIQADNVRLFEVQRQAGAVALFEVTQSRLALNQTRSALHDAEAQVTTARMQLAQALGLPPAALDGVMVNFDDFRHSAAALPDATVRRQALLNRADLLALLAEYAASQSALQLEIAKQYPDFHLNPGYEYDQGNNKWSLGLALELPFPNRNQGPIAEAEARRATLAVQFNALQARVLSEIEQAAAAHHAAVKKAEDAEALISELDAQWQIRQKMLAAGEISRLELGQQQLELTSAELGRLSAHVQVQAALGVLEDALQSPAAMPTIAEASPRSASADRTTVFNSKKSD